MVIPHVEGVESNLAERTYSEKDKELGAEDRRHAAALREPESVLADTGTAGDPSSSPTDCVTWQRFSSDGGYWWYGSDGTWFLESHPDNWMLYVDPDSQRRYWWKSDEH